MITFALPTSNAIARAFFTKIGSPWTKSVDMRATSGGTMSDSHSRRFATWAFSFEPLGRNPQIAAATHISDVFCPRRPEIEKEHHPLRELVPRRSALPQDYPRNHGKRSLRPDEVFVTGAIRSKASSRRRHLLQEPREAKPSARGGPQLGRAHSRGDPQIGKPAARKPSSCEIRTTPKATLQALAMRQSSERTPARR